MEEILHQLIGKSPIIYRVSYMSGGAGFLPSKVGDFDSAMQQIHFRFSGVFQAVSSNPSLPNTIATMSIRPYLKWNVLMLLFGYPPYPGCWLITTRITIISS